MSTSLRTALIAALLLPAPLAQARNMLSADGPGGTYELIRTAYTTELPDCGHMVPHITEVFDDELKKNVFVFHAHVAQDDDRCGASDRQRTEIRARAGDIVASEGQTVYYSWKFKLPTGFQTSPNFTHIMQIKSDEAAPVMTLTPRNNTMSIDGRIGARGTTDLGKFIGHWVFAQMRVTYGNSGSVSLTIRRISNGEMLFNYSGSADTFDSGTHDSKFGIYRSLNNRGALRDEQVRFADFCASKASAAECADGSMPTPPPPADGGAPMPDAGGSSDGGRAPDAGTGGTGGSGTGGSGGSGGSGGTGGSTATGGSSGSGGSSASGGSSGTGGSGGSSASGGSSGTGGSGGSGSAGRGGSSGGGSAGRGGSGAGGTTTPPNDPAPAGCTCGVGGSGVSSGSAAGALMLFGLLALARRRRR